MRKSTSIFWAADLGIFLLASLIYEIQGGFGGGHGRLDLVLFLLAIPWALVPWPETAYTNDFLWLILIPFLINSTLVAGYVLFCAWRKPGGGGPA